MKIYLAGPLFTAAERKFNLELAQEGDKLEGDPEFVDKVFVFCLGAIDECDCMVAVLEGADADSGTCVEMGYAYARDMPIIGIRTDIRSSEDRGLNLMVSNVCEELIWEPGASLEEVAALAAEALSGTL